jgi:hypothetical protein
MKNQKNTSLHHSLHAHFRFFTSFSLFSSARGEKDSQKRTPSSEDKTKRRMSTFAMRTTFPNSPFETVAPADWSSEWMGPMMTTPTTSGVGQARVDVIECPDSFCVYFGESLLSYFSSLL